MSKAKKIFNEAKKMPTTSNKEKPYLTIEADGSMTYKASLSAQEWDVKKICSKNTQNWSKFGLPIAILK